jgi:hypothetical protein
VTGVSHNELWGDDGKVAQPFAEGVLTQLMVSVEPLALKLVQGHQLVQSAAQTPTNG